MNARRAVLLLSLAALGACDRLGGTAIDMANPPRMKAGLWAGTVVMSDRQTSARFCDGGRRIFAPRPQGCTVWQAVRLADGSLDSHSDCAGAGRTYRSHRHIVGDLSSGFTDDVTAEAQIPGLPKTAWTTHAQYRYLGACPPGMKVASAPGG